MSIGTRLTVSTRGFPDGTLVKNPPTKAGGTRNSGWIPDLMGFRESIEVFPSSGDLDNFKNQKCNVF